MLSCYVESVSKGATNYTFISLVVIDQQLKLFHLVDVFPEPKRPL